jgi:hypothetical protein
MFRQSFPISEAKAAGVPFATVNWKAIWLSAQLSNSSNQRLVTR